MRVAHLIASAAVAALTSLAFATPASADNPALPIHEDHIPMKAADFHEECNEQFEGIDETNKDGWHFILPGGGSFVTLTLKFHTPGGDVTAVISSTDENAPSSGAGWEGYLDNAGANDKHGWVFTNAGWELFEATASTTGESSQFFVLSHTCAGTPDTPGSPSSPTSPDPDPSDSESPDPSESASTPGGDLPTTGTKVGGFAIAGVALLAGGVALLAVRRRRQITEG